MRFQLEKGFSLIEVLISVAILAIAIIALVGVFPQGIHQVMTSEQISTMNHLAQSKLDDLRATSWNDDDLVDGTHPSTTLGDPALVETNDNYDVPSGYSVEWSVDTTGTGTEQKKTITIEVGYLMFNDDATEIPEPAGDQARGPLTIHRRTATYTTTFTVP